jgi:hypothetical protein
MQKAQSFPDRIEEREPPGCHSGRTGDGFPQLIKDYGISNTEIARQVSTSGISKFLARNYSS